MSLFLHFNAIICIIIYIYILYIYYIYTGTLCKPQKKSWTFQDAENYVTVEDLDATPQNDSKALPGCYG